MLEDLLILIFYRISFSTPEDFFFTFWMVDGVCLNYDDVENEQRSVLFLDTTDAAGCLLDCVQKWFTQGDSGHIQSKKPNSGLHQPAINRLIGKIGGKTKMGRKWGEEKSAHYFKNQKINGE